VLEALTDAAGAPWPALSTAGAALVGLAVPIGLRTEVASVDRLWSRWAVRATVGVASTAAGVGIVAAAEFSSLTTASVDVGAAALTGIALLAVGAAGIRTALRRANERRIKAEHDIATLGRRYDAPGRWVLVLWVGIAVVHVGLAGASLAYADGSYSAFAFSQGVLFLFASTTRTRTWGVSERGLIADSVEHPWTAIESVRVDGGSVQVRFDSWWRGLWLAGASGSLRFAREGTDERAVELLGAHADALGDPRHYTSPPEC